MKSVLERFEEKLCPEPNSGCWIWLGAYGTRQGYGSFRIAGRNKLAHMVAYELAYGPVPKGKIILHKCKSAFCARPDHLFLGTKLGMVHRSAEKRFWDKVSPEPNSGCWIWLGAITNFGYGVLRVDDRNVSAYRWAYLHFRGTISDGLECDHLCRTPCCVNPYHIELVTHKENCGRGIAGQKASGRQLAKTHCPRGHPYSGNNLSVKFNKSKGGMNRVCKECHRIAEIVRWRLKRG